MASRAEPVIRVRDLVVGFGDTTVIDRLSLDVYRGGDPWPCGRLRQLENPC